MRDHAGTCRCPARATAPRDDGAHCDDSRRPPTRPSSGTSASSPTSTTASRRWPTGCSQLTGVVEGAQHARPVPRPDGHRARARHHHQGAERAAAVDAATGRAQHRVRAQPDRHPGPRRLHLRGVPVAGRLRGRRPAGRRRAGHRGADPGQPVPGAGERPARSSRCSTRSTCRPPSPRSTPRRSRTSSAATPTTCCGSAARPARASPELLDEIVARDPGARSATPTRPARAMIFDSVYDIYRGVITYVRVVDGRITARERIQMMSTGATHELLEIGVISPEPMPDRRPRRRRGRLPDHRREGRPAVPGRRHRHRCAQGRRPSRSAATATRSRWSTPASTRSTAATTRCCARRWTSCSSTTPRWSTSRRPRRRSGFGFRVGFLGLLHLEIVRERLEREFGLDLISTAPNVVYRVVMEDGTEIIVTNPSDWPAGKIADDLRAGRQRHDHRARATTSARSWSCARAAAAQLRRHGLPVRVPGRAALHAAARRDHLRLLRRAEVAHPRLRLARLRAEAGEQESDLVKVDILLQGEAGRRVQRDRAQGQGLRLRRRRWPASCAS